MWFFKRYHWLEAKESIDLETCAEPWNPPFKNEEDILKFADNLETSKELKCKSLTVFHDEQLNQVLFHN